MTVETFIAFNLALLAALASPGPAFVMMTKTVITRGLLSGIKFGAGLGFMAATWTTAALMGLETIFKLFPWTYITIKTAGGAYLLYIAYNTFKNAHKPITEDAPTMRRDFLDGLLVNFANPKSVLFAGSILVLIFPPNMPLAYKAAVVVNHFTMELMFYSMIAFVFGNTLVRQKFLTWKSAIDRVSGALIAALGLKLLIQR